MTATTQKPIVIMAGGTGGHVFPALAVAEYLRDKGESIVWLGTRAGIEAQVVPAAGFPIEWLSVQGLRGKNKLTLIFAPFQLIRACWQALMTLLRLKPRAVLGMGGFVSGPGGLMARVLNLPLFVHEQNSISGLTNRLLSRLATKSYFAFPQAAQKVARSEIIGNPVRVNLINLPKPAKRMSARIDKPMNLLVIGGSLGAASLNRYLPEALALLDTSERPVVKHQCGKKHLETCQKNYQEARVNVEVVDFIDDMSVMYQWADVVVCRAGALTVAEIAAVGVASILIPFPFAVDDHQFYNAQFLQQNKAARLIVEKDLSAESLALLLRYFQQNRDELIEMANQARALAKVDATEQLGNGILAGALS